MKILIEDEGQTLTISNDFFTNDNFVTVEIDGKKERMLMDVPISDLYTAVKALYEDRTRRREADKLL